MTLMFLSVGAGMVWETIAHCFIERAVHVDIWGLSFSISGYWAFVPGVLGMALSLSVLWLAYTSANGTRRDYPAAGRMNGIPISVVPYRDRRKQRESRRRPHP